MVLYHTAKLPISLSLQNVVMFETITQSNFISKYPSFAKINFPQRALHSLRMDGSRGGGCSTNPVKENLKPFNMEKEEGSFSG